MWKEIKIGEQTFRLKHTFSGGFHKIHLTDFVSLWFEEINENSLLMRCKDMNKLVEASDDVFLSHVISLLENVGSNVIRDLDESNEQYVLYLQTVLDGLKFKIKFVLTKANPLKFNEEVTRPLLTIASHLEKQREALIDLVKRKDVEILEYKMEGAQITRKTVETVPFDERQFSDQCIGDVSICKSLVQSCPYSALTPAVLTLWRSIEEAQIVSLPNSSAPDDESEKRSSRENTCVKLKSLSSKNRKPMYEDDDDDQREEVKEKKTKKR